MSNGVEAMRQQRERRGKPEPMHPRQGQDHGAGDEQVQEQGEDRAEVAADASDPADTGEQSGQDDSTQQQGTQQQAARSGGGKSSSSRGKSTGKGSKGKQVAAASSGGPDGGAAGQAQAKQVADVALGWAAAARKQADRAEQVRGAVELARQMGAPDHAVLSGLRAAEYRAGVQLPDEVWRAAGYDH